jgi:protein-tyrosine-phosphatase
MWVLAQLFRLFMLNTVECNQMIHIHFICRGNVYRSRLAEAYAKSLLKDDSDIEISSSGIEAKLALHGDVVIDALKALEADNLKKHLAPSWQQTTQDLIDRVDLLVFMNDSVYHDASKLYNLPKDKCVIWHIKDVDNIYPQVKKQVDILMSKYV